MSETRSQEETKKAEALIQRNPHKDFKAVEASRPDWDTNASFHYTKTASPDWKFGDGANCLEADAPSKSHVSIDPYAQNRPGVFNYKLLISGITPRPIAFVSTRSKDGKTTNLAPFSYFNLINNDPPLFVVGFACGVANAKDTLRNVIDTEECVINIISESFLEAANATSIDAPYGSSEWDVSGLTPSYDCETVKCARVKESVFSIEAKLDTLKEYASKVVEGKITGTVCIFEGTKFWVREDALNDQKNIIDPAVSQYHGFYTTNTDSKQILRPISRLGGITYGRVTEAIELPRPDFEKHLGGQEALEKIRKSKELAN